MRFRGAFGRDRSRIEVLFASAIRRIKVCLFIGLFVGKVPCMIKEVPVCSAMVMF